MASPVVALESPLLSALHRGVGAAVDPALESALDPCLSSALASALESTLDPRGAAAEGGRLLEDGRGTGRAEGLLEVDRKLFALCCERGPLRAVLARIASRLVNIRAWERIGYARLSDYAVECLGISARSVRSLAEVGTRFGELPRLEDALVAGRLGWTKVRLLARLPPGGDEGRWIAYARGVTAEELSRAVRAVDRGSIEAGAAEEAGARSRLFEVRCTPEVRWKWRFARGAAARAAGRVLHISEAAELIAAEVLSALPIDERAERAACEEAGVSWSQESEPQPEPAGEAGPPDMAPDLRGSELCVTESSCGQAATAAARQRPWQPHGRDQETSAALRTPWRAHRSDRETNAAPGPPWRAGEDARPARPAAGASEVHGTDPAPAACRPRPFSALALPPALVPFLEGLDEADAFEVDDRFRRALSLEQRLEARIGPLLALVWGRFVHRALGYASRDAYARERLGMDPTRARALVRLERAAGRSEAFARAYRTGALSWVKADVLAPLVTVDPLGRFVEDWVAWAGRVSVRRLSEDIERALALAETDPEAFRRGGGLPPEAQDDREIGAAVRDPREEAAAEDGREIGAAPLKSAPEEICWARFFGPPDSVQLFRAVLCSVRRRMEQDRGPLPTAGEALGAMLDHALSSWGAIDSTVAARYRVFARDGWRCAVPGCTSMQNLHDHHIRFRSAGGKDAPENRSTLCAFHHLRGVHAGLLRCVGRAPDGLRWEMGIRPGVKPLLAYRSGDVRVDLPTTIERAVSVQTRLVSL